MSNNKKILNYPRHNKKIGHLGPLKITLQMENCEMVFGQATQYSNPILNQSPLTLYAIEGHICACDRSDKGIHFAKAPFNTLVSAGIFLSDTFFPASARSGSTYYSVHFPTHSLFCDPTPFRQV